MKFIDMLNKYDKIIIPDLQRDYTLGSIGYKLKPFLDFVLSGGNLSTISGYVENNNLYIYDGQQRIVTLMMVYKVSNNPVSNKLVFENKLSNEYYHSEMCKDDFKNYTGQSLYNCNNIIQQLISSGVAKYRSNDMIASISNLDINLYTTSKLSFIEQLYLDLNDSYKVEDYEIQRANILDRYKHSMPLLHDNLTVTYTDLYYTKYFSDTYISNHSLSELDVCESSVVKLVGYLIKYGENQGMPLGDLDKLIYLLLRSPKSNCSEELLIDKETGSRFSDYLMNKLFTGSDISTEKSALVLLIDKLIESGDYTNNDLLFELIVALAYKGRDKSRLKFLLSYLIYNPVSTCGKYKLGKLTKWDSTGQELSPTPEGRYEAFLVSPFLTQKLMSRFDMNSPMDFVDKIKSSVFNVKSMNEEYKLFIGKKFPKYPVFLLKRLYLHDTELDAIVKDYSLSDSTKARYLQMGDMAKKFRNSPTYSTGNNFDDRVHNLQAIVFDSGLRFVPLFPADLYSTYKDGTDIGIRKSSCSEFMGHMQTLDIWGMTSYVFEESLIHYASSNSISSNIKIISNHPMQTNIKFNIGRKFQITNEILDELIMNYISRFGTFTDELKAPINMGVIELQGEYDNPRIVYVYKTITNGGYTASKQRFYTLPVESSIS